ncbi:MAG: DUF3343 domain-containing protein [Clostridiales bacterium]|nr:DUF3343 domain-containing protein [Clostridiales bacterium]
MEYVIVSFRSREHSVKFSKFLSAHGILNSIVNTPKEAGIGCGLSVKVPSPALYTVKKALAVLKYGSFAGVFKVNDRAGKRVVKPL